MTPIGRRGALGLFGLSAASVMTGAAACLTTSTEMASHGSNCRRCRPIAWTGRRTSRWASPIGGRSGWRECSREHTAITSSRQAVLGGEGFRGGPNGTKKARLELFSHAFTVQFDAGRGELVTEALPDLPRGVSCAVIGIVADTVYVAEGGDFWSLDLANPSSGWQTLPRWPGDPRNVAVGIAQGGRFFLLSGRGTSVSARLARARGAQRRHHVDLRSSYRRQRRDSPLRPHLTHLA